MQEVDQARENQARELPMEAVERLVELVRESGVGEIRVRTGEMEITVKARSEASGARAPEAEPRSVRENAAGPLDPEMDGMHAVRSPLVGTFYRAPAPGEPPYVEVGDRVKAGQTLCIVEAMKLMNEIPADVSGEVAEILAENSEGVEYDQPLFYLRSEE
jgi:acetyl-CoA carboxylase biotin carboxyl carrier protein